MTKKFFWSQDAEPEQKGSFSDTSSQHSYDNVSDFGRADATRNARSSGDEIVEIDDPIDGSERRGGVSQDQRHNLYYSEEDDQGSQSPRKHGPGR